MDTDILVKEGQKLIGYLDESKVRPRGAMWVYSADADSWKLWIVPSQDVSDKREFYRMVAQIITQHRVDLPSMDVGLVEFKSIHHPAVQGLGRVLHMDGIGAANFTNNTFNGVALPNGVVLRMVV